MAKTIHILIVANTIKGFGLVPKAISSIGNSTSHEESLLEMSSKDSDKQYDFVFKMVNNKGEAVNRLTDEKSKTAFDAVVVVCSKGILPVHAKVICGAAQMHKVPIRYVISDKTNNKALKKVCTIYKNIDNPFISDMTTALKKL